MEGVGVLLVGSLIEWVLLLIVIPIAQRIADFSLPPAVEMVWKLAVIVLLKNFIGYGVDEIVGIGLLTFIARTVVFFVGLYKVFDVDVQGAVWIVVLSFLLRIFINTIIMVALFA